MDQKSGHSSSTQLIGNAEIDERVQKYMSKLEENRKQAGIISAPSSQLKEAERRLAEVSISNNL